MSDKGWMTRVWRWLIGGKYELGVISFYLWNIDAYRPSIWIRRPDTGWWVVFLDLWRRHPDGKRYPSLSLKGRWEWLP